MSIDPVTILLVFINIFLLLLCVSILLLIETVRPMVESSYKYMNNFITSVEQIKSQLNTQELQEINNLQNMRHRIRAFREIDE